MGFLDRIAECNRHDLGGFAPFVAGHAVVGWVRRDRLSVLGEVGHCLAVGTDGVRLDPDLANPADRSAAMARVVASLAEVGQLPEWRAEHYAVLPAWGQPAIMDLERRAVSWFGVRAYGVHVNGYVQRDDGVHMWIARRATDKPTYPGMLDNTVAGGQPVGLSLRDNVIKECGEEAGIPADIAATARAVGAVTYCLEHDTGLKPDCMFCFDLELPTDFTPTPVDGEAEAFELWPIERVAATVRDTAEFKFNCNLVVIDFLVRWGLIDERDPAYLDIVRGLRAW